MDFWNMGIKDKLGRASITPLVRRTEKMASDRIARERSVRAD